MRTYQSKHGTKFEYSEGFSGKTYATKPVGFNAVHIVEDIEEFLQYVIGIIGYKKTIDLDWSTIKRNCNG